MAIAQIICIHKLWLLIILTVYIISIPSLIFITQTCMSQAWWIMKRIVAQQLAAEDAIKATFFIACNYSGRACHRHNHIYIMDGKANCLAFQIELAEKRSRELFVRSGRAVFHHQTCFPAFLLLRCRSVSSRPVIVELPFEWALAMLCDTSCC